MNRYVRSGLMALGIAVAAGLFAAGFYAADSEDRPLPSDVERIVPSADAIIRPQDSVGIDLADTFTGVLVIDGTEIPMDQVDAVEPLGQVFFQPGPVKEFERFEAGRHSITAVYWERTQTRNDARSFTWNFRVG